MLSTNLRFRDHIRPRTNSGRRRPENFKLCRFDVQSFIFRPNERFTLTDLLSLFKVVTVYGVVKRNTRPCGCFTIDLALSPNNNGFRTRYPYGRIAHKKINDGLGRSEMIDGHYVFRLTVLTARSISANDFCKTKRLGHRLPPIINRTFY